MRRALLVSVLGLVGVLGLAGCSIIPQQSDAGHAQAGEVGTGVGVTRSEITLGALTDHSGPFAELGHGVVRGSQVWIDETNAAGGICGRRIQLTVRDHGHDTSKAKAQYSELAPTVLGLMHVLGSPVTAALSRDLLYDETTVVALSQSSELLDNPYVVIPGATFDVEMINGLSYLMGQGTLLDGDTIGHVWVDGEYGANALRGTRYFAERHRLTVRDAKVAATDSDLRGVIAGLAGDPRVKAIALTTTPAQTAAAAEINQQLGRNVPMIANNPAFGPHLLGSPNAGALGNLAVVASSVPFSSDVPTARQVAEAFQRGSFEGPPSSPSSPSSGVPYGYAVGEIWGQLLRRACANGDITRAGIQEALRQGPNISTGDLIATLDFAKPGAPATREAYIGVPDAAVAGGIRQVTPLFVAPEARSYAAPHQNGD